jgi:hypothetical protein
MHLRVDLTRLSSFGFDDQVHLLAALARHRSTYADRRDTHERFVRLRSVPSEWNNKSWMSFIFASFNELSSIPHGFSGVRLALLSTPPLLASENALSDWLATHWRLGPSAL